ncbi:MAG TPA: type III secretion system export apparatus subunit SctT [Candidatus Avidesulfovibrio excrementigallinarum]|nr:type III secretion system export apparatus subunit SctT [Candidatus Avidesulfovibrio excrementigallinarum]
MDFMGLLQELDVFTHLTALLLGMPRLFALVMVAPFFGSSIVTGQIRTLLVMALYMPLHPAIVDSLTSDIVLAAPLSLAMGGRLTMLFIKEAILGLMIGFIAGIAFWAVQSAGFFMDNQRGASMAEGQDILSGEQSSPLGQLLFQSLCYIFYATGAFLAFMGVVYASYGLWPVTQPFPTDVPQGVPLFFAGKVGWLVGHMLLLAGPIAVACLLTDVSLGLVNRFASQLNVYVLAMPIKSGLVAVLLCVYLAMLLSHAPELFQQTRENLFTIFHALP